MATLTRIANSCIQVTTDDGTTLLDPGSFTWASDEVDRGLVGDVQRVLITHAHADHVSPEFVRWLVDRGEDVTVHANEEVAALLAPHDVEVIATAPDGASFEDVLHEAVPTGDTPPNRAWTVGDVLTHPGDSYAPTTTAPVMALPLLVPWGSTTASVAFAKRLAPRLVIPIHDFYLSPSGRQLAMTLAELGLAGSDVELARLGWGQSLTV